MREDFKGQKVCKADVKHMNAQQIHTYQISWFYRLSDTQAFVHNNEVNVTQICMTEKTLDETTTGKAHWDDQWPHTHCFWQRHAFWPSLPRTQWFLPSSSQWRHYAGEWQVVVCRRTCICMSDWRQCGRSQPMTAASAEWKATLSATWTYCSLRTLHTNAAHIQTQSLVTDLSL